MSVREGPVVFFHHMIPAQLDLTLLTLFDFPKVLDGAWYFFWYQVTSESWGDNKRWCKKHCRLLIMVLYIVYFPNLDFFFLQSFFLAASSLLWNKTSLPAVTNSHMPKIKMSSIHIWRQHPSSFMLRRYGDKLHWGDTTVYMQWKMKDLVPNASRVERSWGSTMLWRNAMRRRKKNRGSSQLSSEWDLKGQFRDILKVLEGDAVVVTLWPISSCSVFTFWIHRKILQAYICFEIAKKKWKVSTILKTCKLYWRFQTPHDNMCSH